MFRFGDNNMIIEIKKYLLDVMTSAIVWSYYNDGVDVISILSKAEEEFNDFCWFYESIVSGKYLCQLAAKRAADKIEAMETKTNKIG